MATITDKISFIEKFAQQKTFITSAELSARGFANQDIKTLVEQNYLLEYTPGIYSLRNSDTTFSHTEVLARYMMPEGILCLADALRYWNITELIPHQVHLAVPEGTKVNFGELPVAVYKLPRSAYSQGIVYFEKEGLTLAVYSAVKTIVDCFDYGFSVPEEHAFKAAYEAVTQKICTSEEIRAEIARRELESDYFPDLYSIIDHPDNIWKYV